MSLLDILGDGLGEKLVGQISRELGMGPKETEGAVGAGLATILGGLQRNARKPEGAQALLGALQRDHDGSSLNDLAQLGQQRAAGDGILKHVLGERRQTVERGLSQTTGLDENATSKLMSMLAPAVMGALGKQQRSDGLDAGGLAGLLGQKQQQVEQAAPQLGMIGKLLDQDGDGDVDLGDLAKVGLSKLFGKK